MRHRRFGRIVNITSAMMTTPPPFMAASSGARTGLTAAMKGLSKKVVRDKRHH
jgi:3-oxoacyl-[acyl-carrier protein] reductase